MILWEALGKNTCVVATSVGAIPWILGPSYPYLAVPNDVLSLAELLSKAITADNKILIRNMNKKSRVADLENLSRMWEREYRVE
jgi:glycosyltransferase involved in cell wall biosynthesis